MSDDVCRAIRRGDHDAQLADISRAIGDRLRTGNVAFRWRVTLPDLEVSEDDLTLDEAFAFEQEAGTTWRDLDPLHSARDARALMITLYRSRLGLDRDAAAERVAALTVRSYLDAVSAVAATENPQPAQGD